MFRSVSAKLHTMRKPQSFTVASMSDGNVMVQSAKSIGTYDPTTRKGRLSVKGETFIHLSLYGLPFEFPEEFTKAVAEALNAQGASTDLGGVVVSHTVTVIGG